MFFIWFAHPGAKVVQSTQIVHFAAKKGCILWVGDCEYGMMLRTVWYPFSDTTVHSGRSQVSRAFFAASATITL